LHAADVYLACGCACANAGALAEFQRSFLAKVPTYLRRMELSPAQVDDIRDELAEQLLVGRGRGPMISDYKGRGPLGAWLRVVAVREAVHVRRRQRSRASAVRPELDSRSRDDPESKFMAQQHGRAVAAALSATIGGLSDEERHLLRMHFRNGMSIDELQWVFRIHRSSVARRLSRLREVILERVRGIVAEELGANSRELDSLMRDVDRHIDISLGQY
jgi:RNA polymerase sigma-70 factor (ECF subfamily)